MDPNKCLEELLELSACVVHGLSEPEDAADDANRLSELALALDEWIRKGGAYPSRWNRYLKDEGEKPRDKTAE